MNCLFSPIRSVTGLHLGDCRDVLREIPDNSIDSIVTDPPYALVSIVKRFGGENAAPAKSNGASGVYARASAGFMGKQWDTGEVAFSEEFWQEVHRVLKPGGHVVSFGGTRTYHRMACAIEDAGFEIRDQLQWLYGTGFPKSHDVSKAIDKLDATVARRERQLRFCNFMRSSNLTRGSASTILQDAGLISPNGTMAGHFFAASEDGQPAVATRELFEAMRPHLGIEVPDWIEELVNERTVESENFKNREVIGVQENAMSGWNMDGTTKFADRDITRPATPEAEQWEGWGTAIKPANEPICLARKPLSEKTVALNVLKWGTGALNIDACRIEALDSQLAEKYDSIQNAGPRENLVYGKDSRDRKGASPHELGRFPANVITDGSVEMPNGAQRFFYSAKASKADRGEGNSHPTVKPTSLMQWLCRLVTPPGGVVLDPFMGSGSTGKAAHLEGFKFVGIEREEEYFEIAKRRVT